MRKKRIIAGLLALGLAGCSSQELDSIRLSADDKELEVGETITIDVEMEPDDVKIDPEAFTVKGKGDGDLTVEDEDVSFKATKEGSVQITLSQNGATSNTLILEIEGDDAEDEEDTEDTGDHDTAADSQDTYSETTQKPSADVNSDDKAGTGNGSSNDTVISWSQSDPLSVDEVISNQKLLLKTDANIWIEGTLPQALMNGKFVLYDDDRVQYLVLNDPKGLVNFGACEATIVGTLSQSGSDLVLTVSQAYPN